MTLPISVRKNRARFSVSREKSRAADRGIVAVDGTDETVYHRDSILYGNETEQPFINLYPAGTIIKNHLRGSVILL